MRMIRLTQIVDMGPHTEDRHIWVNPDHVMTVQPNEHLATVQMVSGWLFRVRESADDVVDLVVGIS